MFREFVVYMICLGVLCMYTTAGAAVQVTGDSLSVQVSNIALVDILEDVSRQGRIEVVGLDNEALHTILISEVFQDLSIETGLERLLGRLNYAFSRAPITGRIMTLYLVSERQNYATSTNLSPQPSQQEHELGADSLPTSYNPVEPSSQDLPPQPLLPHERGDFEDFITSLQE